MIKYMNAPFTIFGKTKDVPVVTFTEGIQDKEPKAEWRETYWTERGEDYYAFLNPEFKRGTIRVVERVVWLRCKEIK